MTVISCFPIIVCIFPILFFQLMDTVKFLLVGKTSESLYLSNIKDAIINPKAFDFQEQT